MFEKILQIVTVSEAVEAMAKSDGGADGWPINHCQRGQLGSPTRDSSPLDTDAAKKKNKNGTIAEPSTFYIELHPSLQGWASKQAVICTRAHLCPPVRDYSRRQAGQDSWKFSSQGQMTRDFFLACLRSELPTVLPPRWDEPLQISTNMPARPWTFSFLVVALLSPPGRMLLKL